MVCFCRSLRIIHDDHILFLDSSPTCRLFFLSLKTCLCRPPFPRLPLPLLPLLLHQEKPICLGKACQPLNALEKPFCPCTGVQSARSAPSTELPATSIPCSHCVCLTKCTKATVSLASFSCVLLTRPQVRQDMYSSYYIFCYYVYNNCNHAYFIRILVLLYH